MTDLGTWAGTGVSVGAVLDVLGELRHHSERTATRTAIVNLVAVARDDASAAEALEVIRGLPGQPGRTLLVIPDESSVGLDAEVRLIGDEVGGQPVWSEEITLRVGGGAVRHLDSLTEPLLFSDIPVATWFIDSTPAPDHALVAVSDAVLVDSRHQPGPAGLDRIDLLAQACTTLDLTWLRTEPWRAMAARLFSPADCTAFAARIDHVEVWGHPSPRRLLAGWLITTLDLDPRSVAMYEAVHAGLRLTGAGAEFTVVRSSAGRQVDASVSVHGAVRGTSVLPLPPKGIGPSLTAALIRLEADPLYLDSLRAALALPS